MEQFICFVQLIFHFVDIGAHHIYGQDCLITKAHAIEDTFYVFD